MAADGKEGSLVVNILGESSCLRPITFVEKQLMYGFIPAVTSMKKASHLERRKSLVKRDTQAFFVGGDTEIMIIWTISNTPCFLRAHTLSTTLTKSH